MYMKKQPHNIYSVSSLAYAKPIFFACALYRFDKEVKQIGIFNKLGMKKDKKPTAVLFIDYEHWYVSMYRKFSMKPKIKEWRDMVAEKYNIKEILFFGDFSSTAGMKFEIPRVREITNMVIETQNTSPHYKKDFTDFIMLDYIYQRAMSSKNIDAFIIFTGDGHFSSVVRFLTNVCKKEVGIYAVRDSLSTMLKNSASWCIELPSEKEIKHRYYSMILNQFQNESQIDGRKFFPTIKSTVDTVTECYLQNRDDIEAALSELLECGYLYQEYKYFRRGKRLRILKADFEKMKNDGFIIVNTEPSRQKSQKK